MHKKLPIGLLYFPGPRAVAYLNILRQLNAVPSVIITLQNEKADVVGLVQEAKENHYARQYFDVEYSLQDYLNEHPVKVIHSGASSINAPQLAEILAQQNERQWIFSGGGILKSHLFQGGHRYIHVHPGKLPEFRGSTCFYYSLLKDMSLYSSAFYMSPTLDDGEVILQTQFRVNLNIGEHNSRFVDHILDPWIRAVSLQRVLQTVLDGIAFNPIHHTLTDSRAYYVIHPLLRNLTAKKLNKYYQSSQPEGIETLE